MPVTQGKAYTNQLLDGDLFLSENSEIAVYTILIQSLLELSHGRDKISH